MTGDDDSTNPHERPRMQLPLSATAAAATDLGIAGGEPTAIERLRTGPWLPTKYLGKGTFGEVWRVEHEKTRVVAALKLLWPEMSRDRHVEARFRREVGAMAMLPHSLGVARVLEFGKAVRSHGRLYCVMEYIDAPTLAQYLANRAPSLDDALWIARQLAAALESVHAAGIAHRDIKPENIMIRDDSQLARRVWVTILDFGIARTPRSRLTQVERVAQMGTPDYVAPEQAVEPNAADCSADLFALGALLAEMVGIRVWPRGATMLDVAAKQQAWLETTRAALHTAQLPEPVRALILALLDLAPDRRPTALQVREAIDAYLEPRRTVAPLPPRRRAPLWPALAVLQVVTLIAVIAAARRGAPAAPAVSAGQAIAPAAGAGQAIAPAASAGPSSAGQPSAPGVAQPPARSVCSGGRVAREHTGGQCCWPGQGWNGIACVGPPSCPVGRPVDERGQTCAACEAGSVADAASGACCWPGQRWTGAACAGEPRCLPGRIADGDRCVAPAWAGAWSAGRWSVTLAAGDEPCGTLAAWAGAPEPGARVRCSGELASCARTAARVEARYRGHWRDGAGGALRACAGTLTVACAGAECSATIADGWLGSATRPLRARPAR